MKERGGGDGGGGGLIIWGSGGCGLAGAPETPTNGIGFERLGVYIPGVYCGYEWALLD